LFFRNTEVCRDRLRAEAIDGDAIRAVGDRQPLLPRERASFNRNGAAERERERERERETERDRERESYSTTARGP
jgi:hypothetical protein